MRRRNDTEYLAILNSAFAPQEHTKLCACAPVSVSVCE